MVIKMKKTDIKNFVQILKDTYPDATCSLDFKTPFQMVVAVTPMLSASSCAVIFNNSITISMSVHSAKSFTGNSPFYFANLF